MAGIRSSLIGGGLITVLVVAGTWALFNGDSEAQDHGRLEALKPLAEGVWYERGDSENEWRSRTVYEWAPYEWALGGEQLLEHVVDASSGDTLREGRFYWQGGKEYMAYEAHLPGGEIRQGIVRAIENGLAMQYSTLRTEGLEGNYKLRIRFLENGGSLWTVHRQAQDAEILDHESSFVRKNR
jgi:hypothetical protein